ncbi:MAG: MFS transporter [Betaproteobacteria bacterium]|jgi:MFS family permease|nr:MFS transporter [Pseudomonadota bacterium]NBO96269.1 MFS transporter [Betaproteobacteria bacterium]NBP35308.1 MFS transporter [Betaproteobacteria bacterium]NBP38659.1 MFS transporter [Betaproteobacteria bacterium]NBQ77820.1 MFS transporter [Betaproteobacteria bacterium]
MSQAFIALAVTLAAQIATTLSLNAPAVLAPIAAPALGLPAERIGWFTGLAYCSAMFTGLIISHQVRRIGAVRLTQWAMLASALGLALIAMNQAWLVLPAAITMGLGYGCTNPAAADILTRHTPAHRRGLFFSIKQTGVPLGVGFAGLSLSALLAWFDWQLSSLLLTIPCLAVALLSQPSRRQLEAHQLTTEAHQPSSLPQQSPKSLLNSLTGPLHLVFGDQHLRRLGLSSLAYSSTQICFVTFLVSYFHLELKQSISFAALVLAGSQLVSTLGRVFWGYVSDQWLRPDLLLGLLGLGMAACMLWLSQLTSQSSQGSLIGCAMACAATVVAWNGVYFAEMAHRAPPGLIAQANGGTQFITFFGGMVGPVLFGLGVSASGTYSLPLACCCILPTAAGLSFLRAHRIESTTKRARAQ